MSKHPKLVSVKVKNRDINKALKIFKRRVNDSAHLQELRERKYFEKPSLAKRKAKQQACHNNRETTFVRLINIFWDDAPGRWGPTWGDPSPLKPVKFSCGQVVGIIAPDGSLMMLPPIPFCSLLPFWAP